MKTIQKIMMAAALTCAIAATASAVEYGQPVKEVEKEARSAVTGFCSQTTPAQTTCELATVPAGKILAVRNVSMHCQSLGASEWGLVLIGGGNSYMHLPMPLMDSSPGAKVNRTGSASAFLHVEAGQKLFSIVQHSSYVTGARTYCTAYFQGFLIDKQ